MNNDLANDLFEAGCIKFGQYTLKSGIISPVYCDFRILVSKPKLLKKIARAIDYQTEHIGCTHYAGIPYAGIPLALAASFVRDIPMIYPRKEVKDYGTKKSIEGIYQAGDEALVIDDLITDGASKIEAIAPLKDAGLVVYNILVILDRAQGGKEKMAEAGYALHSLMTLPEVMDTLVIYGRIPSKTRDEVTVFIAQNQFT